MFSDLRFLMFKKWLFLFFVQGSEKVAFRKSCDRKLEVLFGNLAVHFLDTMRWGCSGLFASSNQISLQAVCPL